MPITPNDQLQIITDILHNQQLDCCGTVSECQQMQRIIKSLLANPAIDNQLKPTLEDIYYFSQKGASNQNLDQHITSNQFNINQWVDNLIDNVPHDERSTFQ